MSQPQYLLIPEYKSYKQEIVLFEGIEDMLPLTIYLPDPPKFSTVHNFKTSVAGQKWKRREPPKSFARFRGMSREQIHEELTDEEVKYILQEYDYIENGYFFFNNGDLIWLTGIQYMYLQWWKIDIGHPRFIYADAKYFWHWWNVCRDNDSAGMVDMECRRGGKSFRSGVIAYTETFTKRDVMTGIQSKTDDDAEKMFQKTVVKPWKRLPFFLQPEFDSSNNPRNDLRFYTPTSRGTESRKNMATETTLGSNIEIRSAVDNAFDGEKLWRGIEDEAGKVDSRYSILNRWAIKKHCYTDSTQGGKIIGKSLFTTTIGEMDKSGGQNFKELWDNSDESKKVDGRTVSWLSRHYRPAFDGFVTDEYGYTKKEESMAALQKLFDSARGKPFELAALKRQFPRTLKEAFRSSATDCRFNIEIIDKRLEEFTFENPYLTYGNFKWKDNIQDGEVIFVPCDKRSAKFIVSYLFPDQKQSNKKIMKNNSWWPDNFAFGTAGADPYGFDDAISSRKSRGTGAVFMGHNPLIDLVTTDVSQWKTNKFICTYASRPGKKIYGEDMIMMSVYYGIPMFPERNIPFIIEYFTERGYGGFIMHTKDVNTFRTSKAGGATTNDPMIDSMFTEFDHYIDHHGAQEVHAEMLEAARDADPNNLQPCDMFVAGAYALVGEKSKKLITKAAGAQSTSQPLFNTYEMKES